jgi:Sec-independent protein secretion pathway component TatC
MVFAAPMIGLYAVSIGIAWLVAPKREKDAGSGIDSKKLGLVITATVFEQARKRRRRTIGEVRQRLMRSI